MISVNEILKRQFLALLSLIVLILPLVTQGATETDFLINQVSAFNFRDKVNCGVVKVHSLLRDPKGQTLRQEGVGWITVIDYEVGLITPLHVVAGAEAIFVECNDQYFELTIKRISHTKDIAYLVMMKQEIKELLKTFEPFLLVANKNSGLKEAMKGLKNDWKKHGININLALNRKELSENLGELLLAMSSYGVVSDNKNNFLHSPVLSDLVQGTVDQTQHLIKNLVHLQNLGIQPGLSGSVLIGILGNQPNLISYDGKKWEYQVPIEFLPNLVLGMVVKTKLDGAETVALSLGDIFDFIENAVVTMKDYEVQDEMVTFYRILNSENRAKQQSYVLLRGKDLLLAEEYCSNEYQNSSYYSFSKNKKLEELFKSSLAANDDKGLKYSVTFKDVQSEAELVARGGEYGEGGNNFLLTQSEFLTVKQQLREFKPSEISGFKVMSQTQSLGLYLTNRKCKKNGLLIGKKLIHQVRFPEQKPIKMINFEDVRAFVKKYGQQAATHIKNFGVESIEPFFKFEFSENEHLRIPLVSPLFTSSNSPQWEPLGKKYFKQVWIASQKIKENELSNKRFAEVASEVLISQQYFKMNLKLYLFAPIVDLVEKNQDFQGQLLIEYKNNQWQGEFNYGSCRVKLDSADFYQVNSYQTNFEGAGSALQINFLPQSQKLLSVSIKSLNCPDLNNLAFGEFEIHPNSNFVYVDRANRKALDHQPLDFQALRNIYMSTPSEVAR